MRRSEPHVYINIEEKLLVEAVGRSGMPLSVNGTTVFTTFRSMLQVLERSPVGNVGAAALRWIGFQRDGTQAVLNEGSLVGEHPLGSLVGKLCGFA